MALLKQATAILCSLILPATAMMAQAPYAPYPQQSYPQQQYPQQQYPAQGGQAPAQQNAPLLSPDQLSNLVAPIALYPDNLLGQVLAAATYPLEIAEAQQFLQQNPNLRGQQLIDAAKQQNWDPSVQALVAFPDVMTMLSRDIRWTTDLGNAFLAQQSDVMNAIQAMRARAQQNGRLQSTPQENVTTQYDNGQNAIQIQPTDPNMVYVPQYNPAYVWGPPLYGAYPPLYYPPVSYGCGFDAGVFLGGLFSGFLGFGAWGWGLNWFAHGLFLNGLFFNHFGYAGYHGGFGRAWWAHDPGHRMGVAYPNRAVAGRFGSPSRMDAARNGVRSFAGNGNRGFENRGGSQNFNRGGAQNFNRGGAQNYSRSFSSPQQHFSAPSQHFSAPSQHFSAPSQHFSAPSQHFSAPSQHFSAPSQHFSAPSQHFSAPRSSGGGGHSSGGGHASGGHSGGGHHR